MSYYSPLFNFLSDVENFKINRYVEICKDKYFNPGNKGYLSQQEIQEVENCKFWIKISDSFPKYLRSSFICNIILLSLWVKKPNQVETRFRFGNNLILRQLDRFQFLRIENNDNNFLNDDLIQIKRYYKSFCKIMYENGRLNMALINTFRACQAYHWAVGFLLFSAAFECILTYERGPGITKRLAKTYACLMHHEKKKRDYLFRKFVDIYNIRSEIIHGNQRKYSRANNNIKKLSELSNMLRKLWQKILSEKTLLITLESNDDTRRTFFNRIQNGYTMPKV